MRIIVLGDVHGNVGALRAALEAAERVGCDRIFHTGDLVGYGPNPNETVDLVRARRIEGVKGNFDESAAWDGDSPAAAGDAARQLLAARALRWTVRNLGFLQRNYLKDLPFSLERRVGPRKVSVFHASPIDLYEPIDPDSPESTLEALAGVTGAELHLFGHTHRPFHRVADGRHFINAGSVGKPEDGDPRACLAVVHLDGGVRVEFQRIPYDVERTARETESAGLPRELATAIRTGN